MSALLFGLAMLLVEGDEGPTGTVVSVVVPFVETNEIDLPELVARLASATNLAVGRPSGDLALPIRGVAGNLSRKMLAASLGDDVRVAIENQGLVLTIDPGLLASTRRAEWEGRVQSLARDVERETRRRLQYGMHALKSYQPNDPNRPTVCLVHGVNSSSGGFVHMIPPLEEAGFGVVVYDYAFNRSIEESGRRFADDWAAFRSKHGEKRSWSLVGHSMGALIARDYVEGSKYGGDVANLELLAPVNQGSYLAQTQTILQLLNSARAVNGRKTSEALAHLGDGLGQAAADMTPGSHYLRLLNARPRRDGVAYHILAGDVGIVPAATRRQVQAQIDAVKSQSGMFAGLARIATGDLSDRLDEVTDGTGDGCVSVARTRLEGVSDHVVIHANHAELIRAPLLFADPGPVACMPYLLKWLGKPSP